VRTIDVNLIKNAVKSGFLEICVNADKEIEDALKDAAKTAPPLAAFELGIMCQNFCIARELDAPFCQDTGMALVFCEIGQDARLCGGSIEDAVNLGVREAYAQGNFRAGVLDPLTRKNTLDNTPAVIHYEIKEGDGLTLKIMAKGFGSENMSRLFMLSPSRGEQGIIESVTACIKEAGANPCPPVIVGVGIGGTMEKAALLSKKALFRSLNSRNEDPELDRLEKTICDGINKLNIGAGGYGGVSALKVCIEKYPTHIAGLPVAITVQCHAARHKIINL
jgi:fumarate hydratase subunit alpha